MMVQVFLLGSRQQQLHVGGGGIGKREKREKQVSSDQGERKIIPHSRSVHLYEYELAIYSYKGCPLRTSVPEISRQSVRS